MAPIRYRKMRSVQQATRVAAADNTDHVQDTDAAETGIDDESATPAEQPPASAEGALKRVSEAVDGIDKANEAVKPKKARDQYAGPEKEWVLWCEHMAFEGPDR